MSDEKVTIISTGIESRVIYNRSAALQVISGLMDEEAPITVTSCLLADFTRLIDACQRPHVVPAEKKPVKKEMVEGKKHNKSKANNTGRVMSVLETVTSSKALTLSEISKRSGVKAAIGEVLMRLSKTGRIQRTKERPYKYWGSTGADDGYIHCAARGKKIDPDVCLPNDKLDACKTCNQNT